MNPWMIKSGRRLMAMLLAGLLAAPPVWADDTELYFNKAPVNVPPPLVMLTLDWRPNLGSTIPACSTVDSTACRNYFGTDEVGTLIHSQLDKTSDVKLFDTFRAVFKAIFASDVADGTRVGLMMSHNNNNNCKPGDTGCSNGGYVLRGFELFQPGDANGAKDELLKIMAAIPLTQGNFSHPYQGRELFFELYRYLAGLDVMNAKLGYTDFASQNPGGTSNRNLDYEFTVGKGPAANQKCAFTVGGGNSGNNRECTDYLEPPYNKAQHSNLDRDGERISSALTWDPTIMVSSSTAASGARYVSPYNNDEDWSCSGAYSINMLFQVSQQEADSDTAIAKPLAEQGLALSGSGQNSGFTPMIARLNQIDHAAGQAPGAPNVAGQQNLTSYFLVDQVNTTTNGYAAAGGTGNAIGALANPRALFEALGNIFNQIKAVSSTFVAVTVPVNADNRVDALPHVFVALFQVDENGRPFWPGNIKKLDAKTKTLEDGSKQLDVLDANGNAAFNPNTGRIDDNALTFWTVPNAADVVAADASKNEVSGRDGSSVRRGGAGHKIPGYRSGSVGLRNTDAGARQIFLEPESFDPLLQAGNDLVPLDASSDSGALRENVDVQTRFGFRDLSAACSEKDGTWCLSAIKKVLDAAGVTYPGSPSVAQKETMARNATQALLRWIRGFDVFNDAGASSHNGLTTTVKRKWLMGDVLHSRPVAINYGARPPGNTGYGVDNQDVRLVFGANDGLLRMVRNTAAGLNEPAPVTQQGNAYGQEVWAFMPRELLAQVPRWAMDGRVELNRPYGVDGEPALFTIDTNEDGIIDNDGNCTVGADDCDRAWVYFGLRRGGKSYYAIDVSNPDAQSPKLMWKVDDSMANFAELGMTFSTPRVGWVQFEDVPGLNLFGADDVNVPVPVVIVGGGYHGHSVTTGDHHWAGIGGPSKDTILGTPYTGTDEGEGNAIFIIHARTGELIWKATLGASTGGVSATKFTHVAMAHGIAASVAPMDANRNGILDRLYVPDTGGRVWRIDLPEFVAGISPADHRKENWKASLLADLRPADLSATPDDDLRFFHRATIVRRARDAIGLYDAIALGSGDREHPQSETNKKNWFFLFKDRNVISGDPAVASRPTLGPGDLADITNQCLNVSAGTPCAADLGHGWKLALEEKGEKNLSTPFIGGNGIIFTTYLPEGIGPDDDLCVPLGSSRLYQVGLASGEPLPFLHGEKNSYEKDDRWVNLYSGIDGGVTAVNPDFWMTPGGYSGKNPPQKPVQFHWRESGIDTLQ